MRKRYHELLHPGCILPKLPDETIGIILAYVPTKRILHHRPRAIYKQPSYYFPPTFHLKADSFLHSDFQRLLELRFNLDLHLQIGSEDETIYPWESIAEVSSLCEAPSLRPCHSSRSLRIKQLSLFLRRETRLLQLIELLKWTFPSVDKLQMRLFYPSKKASGRLKQVLNDSVGFEPKEVTVCCHLFVSLGRITPFRLVKNLTFEDNCEDFQTLLQLMASSMPVLSYLDVYGIKLNESDGPRLPLEAGEIGVNMESLRCLRVEASLLKYFGLCKNVEILGLKFGSFGNYMAKVDEAIRASAAAFKTLLLVELKDYYVTTLYSL